jgi:putative ABC transport system permease protein
VLYVGLVWSLGSWTAQRFGVALNLSAPSANEVMWVGGVVLAGLLASLVPGWRAYRLSLMDGLSPRV